MGHHIESSNKNLTRMYVYLEISTSQKAYSNQGAIISLLCGHIRFFILMMILCMDLSLNYLNDLFIVSRPVALADLLWNND